MQRFFGVNKVEVKSSGIPIAHGGKKEERKMYRMLLQMLLKVGVVGV